MSDHAKILAEAVIPSNPDNLPVVWQPPRKRESWRVPIIPIVTTGSDHREMLGSPEAAKCLRVNTFVGKFGRRTWVFEFDDGKTLRTQDPVVAANISYAHFP